MILDNSTNKNLSPIIRELPVVIQKLETMINELHQIKKTANRMYVGLVDIRGGDEGLFERD
jgi:hypothetical protein